jgi:hypothetical protein
MRKPDMRTDHREKRLSYIVLCAGLVLVTVLFGVRVKYAPALYYGLAVIQITLICVAAWNVGVWAIRAEAERSRMLSLAGALLIAPWALFSFLPGIGPPGDQTAAENELRYVILFINAIAIAVGFVVLREALVKAGEQFYSTLGFATILVATSLYLFWATIAVGYFRAKGVAAPEQLSPSIISLVELSDIPLFFGGALTYLTSAAFAASLGRAQWLGRGTTRAFVTVSFVALLFLLIRGLWFPNPKTAFAHWYTIPGFIVGIPAVPWIMPLLFGVVLLRRAGREQGDSAA